MEKVSLNKYEHAYKKSDKIFDVILRQELKSFTPNCNLRCAIICNLIMIILFASFGIPIIILSYNSEEYSVDYTNW